MGNERTQDKSFAVHGWFEAAFQEWRINGYTCENCSCFRANIGMELGMKICGILTMKRGHSVRCEAPK